MQQKKGSEDMADGSITFSTALDNSELERDLQSLSKKIERTEEKIAQRQAERAPLAEQSKQLAAELDAAKGRLEYMKSGAEYFSAAQVKTQTEAVRGMETDWGRVQGRVEQYDRAIQNAGIELDRSKEKAGGIAQELAAMNDNAGMMAPAFAHAEKALDRFALRLRQLARRALVFYVISSALRSLREWVGKVVKTNSEASVAIARLKGALLTLVQPLVSVVIPAFTAFVNVLAKIISVIAQLFAMLTGKSIESSKSAAKALNDQTKALDETGAAAKDAGKQMAGFDEINKLSGDAGASGGASADAASADFGFLSDLSEGQMERILRLAELIGAALLYWKLPKALQGGLKTFLGLLIAIDGAVRFVRNLFSAWNDGINWDNLKGMLIGAAELAAGLWLAFGPVAAGISLVVTGLLMLATGFRDAFQNGWNLQNLLTAIAGILATGLGIALIAGSWIPALVAGILAVVLAITVAYGEGENLIKGIKTMLQGFIDFFVGVFTGDFERAIKGIGGIFSGLRTVFTAILDAIKNMFNSFLDFLDAKTQGKITGIINWIRSFINASIETIKTTLLRFVSAVEEVFTGITEFLAGVFTGNWEQAWTGIKNIFKGILNGMVGLFEGMVNFVIGGINALIDAFNALLSLGDKVADLLFGTTMRVPNISPIAIPRLATGAVIPPNREFLAVLGDQKTGTNIEAPLETMVQAFKTAAREMGGGVGDITIVMEVDKQQLGKVVYRLNKAESRRVGVNLAGV